MAKTKNAPVLTSVDLFFDSGLLDLGIVISGSDKAGGLSMAPGRTVSGTGSNSLQRELFGYVDVAFSCVGLPDRFFLYFPAGRNPAEVTVWMSAMHGNPWTSMRAKYRRLSHSTSYLLAISIEKLFVTICFYYIFYGKVNFLINIKSFHTDIKCRERRTFIC